MGSQLTRYLSLRGKIAYKINWWMTHGDKQEFVDKLHHFVGSGRDCWICCSISFKDTFRTNYPYYRINNLVLCALELWFLKHKRSERKPLSDEENRIIKNTADKLAKNFAKESGYRTRIWLSSLCTNLFSYHLTLTMSSLVYKKKKKHKK